MEWINISISGLTFLAIIYVTVVQQRQINSMKDFTSIFDTKKVRDFVEMREETVMMKATQFVKDDDKIKKLLEDTSSEKANEVINDFKNELSQEFKDKFNEMGDFIVNFLAYMPEDFREELLNRDFPKTKDDLLDSIEDYLTNNPDIHNISVEKSDQDEA